MEFKIDRSKWRCGDDGKYAKGLGKKTYLNNKEGYMCCLGQTLCQQGVPQKHMERLGKPSEIDFKYSIDVKNIFFNSEFDELGDDLTNTELTYDAMDINDDKDTTLKEKESALKELFKKHGHKISFYGKSVKYEH